AQEWLREPSNRIGVGWRELFDRGQCRGHTDAGRPINREQNIGRAAPQRERQEVDHRARKPLRPDDTERRELRDHAALYIAHEKITLADFADLATHVLNPFSEPPARI